MGDPIKKMNPLEYYNHPNELIRLLRCFARPQMNPEERITPDYPANPALGAVISTYGSVPFIDLNLHFLVNVNHMEVLIHDDSSPKINELAEVCRKYAPHVSLVSTYQRMWHQAKVGVMGDTNAFLVGLQWAKEKNLDLLLKLSRRMIAASEFATGLKQLAVESDGFTFGNYCDADDFPLRTECMAMSVKAWNHPYITGQLTSIINYNFPVFAEYWFHDLARMLAYANNSRKYREYTDTHRIGAAHNGFIRWDALLGKSRYTPANGALWHSCNQLEEYYQLSQEIFGNLYSFEDFKDVEMF